MKTLYFDTNYLFRLYSNEPGSTEVLALASGAESIATAWHGRAEIASILLRKRRENVLSDEIIQEIRSQIQDDQELSLVQFLPLTEAVMTRLEQVLSQAPSSTYIRAADGLHLACAAEHGFTHVHSNDRHFLSAAVLFGLTAVNVIDV